MKEYVALCFKGERSIAERKQILAKKKELLERKLREVENCIDYIDGKQQFYDDVLSGKIPYTSNLIDIPKENMICPGFNKAPHRRSGFLCLQISVRGFCYSEPAALARLFLLFRFV